MDETDDLDILVKSEFEKLYSELDDEKRKLISSNSIKNIIFYLIDNPKVNPKKNTKLQELGEIRMKKKLLDYFKAVRTTDLDKYSASDLYKEYVNHIGQFMTEYYKFSGDGGKIVVFTGFVILTFGVILDTILMLVNWISFPTFSILFLILFIVRRVIKFKQRRLFGMFY